MSDLRGRLQRIEAGTIERALRDGEVNIRELARLSGHSYAEERRLWAEGLRISEACRAHPVDERGWIDIEPFINWCIAHYGGDQHEWLDGYMEAVAREAARGTA